MVKVKEEATRRDLFRELMAAVEDMAAHREARLTLRTHRIDPATAAANLVAKEKAPGAGRSALLESQASRPGAGSR